MKLWLDDRRFSPNGWVWAKTAAEAIEVLSGGGVEEVSLDHDLGACADCMRGRTVQQWMVDSGFRTMPNCEHFGTGLTVAEWIRAGAEAGALKRLLWKVHSANVDGSHRMQEMMQAADEAWRSGDEALP